MSDTGTHTPATVIDSPNATVVQVTKRATRPTGPFPRVSPPGRTVSMMPDEDTRREAAQQGQVRLWLGAADELRRVRRHEQGLALYQRVLDVNPSARAGAGALACLRKLDRFDDALQLLASLQAKFPDDPLLSAESGWLVVQTEIQPALEKGMVHNAAMLVADLIATCGDDAVKRHAVFATARAAKQRRAWELVDQICSYLDPSTLSDRPRGRDGKGWSDRARWLGARIGALLELDRANEALALAELGVRQFREQHTAFSRWQARALALLGRLEDAQSLYDRLCRPRNADWWLRFERAQVLRQTASAERALEELCLAALACHRMEMGVKLLAQLASSAREVGDHDLAVSTADFVIQLRQRQGWRVPAELCSLLADLGPLPAMSERDRLRVCKKLWRRRAGVTEPTTALDGGDRGRQRPARSGRPVATPPAGEPAEPLMGRLLRPDASVPFCFIEGAHERVFCLAADLPAGAAHGDRLRFFKVRSFDRKKQQQSWRAVDIAIAGEPKGKDQ